MAKNSFPLIRVDFLGACIPAFTAHNPETSRSIVIGIDTGASHSILSWIPDETEYEQWEATQIGSGATMYKGGLKVSPYLLADRLLLPSAVAFTEEKPLFADYGIDALLGFDFLSGHKAVLDFKAMLFTYKIAQ